jgi:hypothetical protein
MKNISQKHSQRFTKAIAQGCLFLFGCSLSFTASAQWSPAGALAPNIIYNNNTTVSRVGIGTQTPNERLHVSNGNILLDYTNVGASTGNLFFGAPTYPLLTNNGMRMSYFTGNNSGYIDVRTSAPTNGLIFRADLINGNAGTERMRICANGNVGIGMGAPTEQLHTSAGVRFQGLIAGVGTHMIVADGSGKLFRSALPPVLACSNLNFVPRVSAANTLDCGVIQDNATNVGIGGVPVLGYRLTIYGAAQFLSDKNYKKNFAPLNNALAKVKQMKGWYYDWDTQKHPNLGLSETRQLGFMAQEVSNILPEAVSKSPEGTVLMNYNAIIPVLTEAIKEQETIIESQKTTIESLEERVNRLETALDKLLGQPQNNLKTPFKLEQNEPNPFSDKTVLAYEMPKNISNAQIIITDLAGRLFKTIQLKDCCGTVEISAQDFTNGTFIYSLVANGKVLKTNKMVVAKN